MDVENEMEYDLGFGRNALVTQDDELHDLQIITDLTAVMLKGEGKVVIIYDLEAHKEDWTEGYTDPADALIMDLPEIERMIEVLSAMRDAMRR